MIDLEKEEPALSIIIVAYKSEDELGQCLHSIPHELSCGRVQIIVVDNAPQGGLGPIMASDFPEVIYIARPDNVGFGRGNNIGFQLARGPLVLFLNPDTICNATALEHCCNRVAAERDIGLISPKLVLATGEMDLACRRSIPSLWDGFCRAAGLANLFHARPLFSGYNLTHLDPSGTYDVGAINGAFMMSRRDVLTHVGVFDESFFMYGDDLDLCIRVGRAGYRIVYDGRVQITHLKGVSVARDFDRMSAAIFDANRDVFLKHFNPRQSRWVRWKYRVAFGLWKRIALLRARRRGYKKVRPL